MLAKKLLRILGLLVISSQISKVSAACIVTITGDNCSITEGSGSDCAVATIKGNYNTVDSSGAITTTQGSIANLVLYNSDGTGCTKVTDIGFFIDGNGNYITRDYNGAFSIQTSDTISAAPKLCTTENTNIGKISYDGTNVVLCDKNGGSGVQFGSNGYIYPVTNSNSIFSRTATDVFAIKQGLKSLIKDTTYTSTTVDADIAALTDGTEYCVNEDGAIGINEKVFCTDKKDCDAYYKVGGTKAYFIDTTKNFDKRVVSTCHPVNDQDSCTEGYYILSTEATPSERTLLQSATTGILYYCDSTTCSEKSSLIGLFKNSDTTNAATIDYIKCERDGTTRTKNSCTAILSTTEYAGANTCAAAGDIILSGSVKFCIDNNASNAVVLETAADYFISSASSINIFINASTQVADHYVVINIGSGNAILSPQIEKKYRYSVAGKIYGKSDNTSICNNVGTTHIEEYVLKKEPSGTAAGSEDIVDYYVKNREISSIPS